MYVLRRKIEWDKSFLKNLISKRYSNVFYELSKRLPHFILTISKRFKDLKLRGGVRLKLLLGKH